MTSPVKPPANDLAYVKSVKAKYEVELMRTPNVVGIGIGLVSLAALSTTSMPAPMQRILGLIVNVSSKPDDPRVIPFELDGVPVAVKETKTIRAW